MRGIPVASQGDVMLSQHWVSWMRGAMEDKTKSMEGLKMKRQNKFKSKQQKCKILPNKCKMKEIH